MILIVSESGYIRSNFYINKIKNEKNFLENIYSSHHIVIFVLYISLIIGFAFNENSTGGAYIDYLGQKQISISFSNSFLETLLDFEQEQTRHSPILIMLFSYFEKIELDDLFIRLINLHICLFLPIFFYKCLKLKFFEIENKYLILFSSKMVSLLLDRLRAA